MLGGCTSKEVIPKLKDPVSESVQGIEIEKTDVTRSLIVQGYVEPTQHGHYYSEQKEKVQYKVGIGEQVSKGQVLAVADGEDLETQKSFLQKELSNVQADLEYEKQRVVCENKRLETLKRYGTPEEQNEATVEQQTLQIETDYQQQLLQLQISNLNREISDINSKIAENTLYASVDGYVSYMSFSETAPAHTNVVMVVDDKDLYIRLDEALDENVIDKFLYAYTLSEGKKQELELVTYSEKEKMLAEKNTMELATKFKVADNHFQSGNRVVVYVVLEEKKNTLAVPKSCIYHSESGNYIYLVRDGKKEKCFVELGISGNIMTEIISGAKEGEMVYYPVDETLTYKDKVTIEKGVGYLKTADLKTEVYHPFAYTVSPEGNIGTATLTSIKEKGFVEQGEVLATLNVASGTADIQEIRNQIDSLNKQYDLQKNMHDANIKRLNEEIDDLEKEQESINNKEHMTESTEDVITQQSTESTETVATEQTTEIDTTTEHDYPVHVEIYLKQVALEMEQLNASKDERIYNFQLGQLQMQLNERQKETGSITVYAPCSGEFDSYLTEKEVGMKLRDGAQIGTITNQDKKYLCVKDNLHQLMFGNEVTVTDAKGKEHKGVVRGYYPSGTADVLVEGDGFSYSYSMNPSENQEKAYIVLDEEVEVTEDLFKSVDLHYQSEAINGAIVIDATNIKKEDGFGYVWIEKEGNPYKQYVEYVIIPGKDSLAYVLNGLSEGDVLLTEVK